MYRIHASVTRCCSLQNNAAVVLGVRELFSQPNVMHIHICTIACIFYGELVECTAYTIPPSNTMCSRRCYTANGNDGIGEPNTHQTTAQYRHRGAPFHRIRMACGCAVCEILHRNIYDAVYAVVYIMYMACECLTAVRREATVSRLPHL